ncbi:MAG TPA: hypothetical protein VJB94_01055 [Candidatus Nanoarchaeia archaeon]|nr:hypothetical protein [Candidatus Nanoarchaeia archaeon]
MGKEKYLNKIEELFKKSPVVSYGSIQRIIRNDKNVKQYTKQLIRNLIIKKKIKRLIKGYYTIYEDQSLIVLCLKQAYLGLQDALSFHDIWEQETIPIIITAKKLRNGIRKVLGTNVLIRRMDKKYYFGVDYYKQGSFYLPYSDIEKTFIDMVYFRENLSESVIKTIRSKINIKKLNLYLKIYPKNIRLKVMNKLNSR